MTTSLYFSQHATTWRTEGDLQGPLSSLGHVQATCDDWPSGKPIHLSKLFFLNKGEGALAACVCNYLLMESLQLQGVSFWYPEGLESFWVGLHPVSSSHITGASSHMQDGPRAVGFFSSPRDPSSWKLSQRGPLEECGTNISDARGWMFWRRGQASGGCVKTRLIFEERFFCLRQLQTA